jgi:hypothetical protein
MSKTLQQFSARCGAFFRRDIALSIHKIASADAEAILWAMFGLIVAENG